MADGLNVVAQDKLISKLFADSIKQIFNNSISVNPYAIDEIMNDHPLSINKTHLFLASCNEIKQKLHTRLENIDILVAQFNLNTTNIRDLLKIPKKSKLLVVMSLEETAADTITLLNKMGFDSYYYEPYWPEKAAYDHSIKIALTAGVPHLVPDSIHHIINFGPRRLCTSTICHILNILKLPLEMVESISNNYISELIKISIELSNKMKILKETESFLNNLLNNVDSVIFFLNQSGQIKFYNSNAKEFLDFINSPLIQTDLKNLIAANEVVQNSVKSYKDESYSIDFLPVVSSSEIDGYILQLKSVSAIQESEQILRKQLQKKGFYAKYSFDDILGSNIKFKEAITTAKKLAKTDLSVLLLGESGAGKEMFAQSIHNESTRNNRPFVAINFAGITQNLVESELFGYEEGSFTGARKGGHIGLFEQSHGGTIFLDEIGDASLDIQVRLLRVLEEKRIIRVGGSEYILIDIRIIAATNKNLLNYVKTGKFREDLYYRLKVAPIVVPPLRERADDIPVIINKILSERKSQSTFSLDLLDFFQSYQWPGNIRQLKNIINYIIVVNTPNKIITLNDIQFILSELEYSEGFSPIKTNKPTVPKFGAEDTLILQNLLKEIKANNKIGRSQLVFALIKKGLDINEYRVRKMLKYLENMDYVKVGTTKQGTSITKKGETFLLTNL